MILTSYQNILTDKGKCRTTAFDPITPFKELQLKLDARLLNHFVAYRENDSVFFA